jgi:hypothetical protein
MTYYQHGLTKAAQEAKEAEVRARQKVAELRRLEAELEARIEARKKQLKHVPKVRTYAPTVEQIRAWEQHAATKTNALPEPLWGGPHNLYLASLEAATWDQSHRRGKRQERKAA